MPIVEITRMTLGAYGVGHLDDGRTVLAPKSAPGDLLDIQIAAERRDYVIGHINETLHPGPGRRTPPCPFAGRCGGCDWQHLAYPAQLAIKAQLVADELNRALDCGLSPSGLVEPAPSEFSYRSRVRFQVGPRGEIGFHESASKRLVEIDRCLISDQTVKLPIKLAAALAGRCREIEVVAAGEGQVLAAHLRKRPGSEEIGIARRIVADDPSIRGVVLRSPGAREIIGSAAISVEIEDGLEIEIEADLFSQVNRAQNRKLVAAVMKMARAADGAEALDLFCGAGNFSLPIARRGARVTGVDENAAAISMARRNAARLRLAETQFIAMGAAETARFLSRAHYRPRTVILDPPRSGAPDLLESIINLRAERVIYVSCNLATLARDLKALSRAGFKIEAVRAFDFFPNTHHVEVAAEMVLT